MKSVLIPILVLLVVLSSSCIMPKPEEQIAANEVKLVEEGYIHPEAGEEAPRFSSVDQDGNSFELTEAVEQGPVLLFFYPANDTPNSTSQLKQLGKLQAQLREEGSDIQIYAVNPADPADTAAYLKREEIELPVLHDEHLEISRQYGCASQDGGTQLQERSIAGINPDGRLAFFQRRFFHRPPNVSLLKSQQYFNIPSE